MKKSGKIEQIKADNAEDFRDDSLEDPLEQGLPVEEDAMPEEAPHVFNDDGSVVYGESGDIPVRSSWLIHPANVRRITPIEGGYLLETSKGNFILTEEEAQPFLPPELPEPEAVNVIK